MLRRRALLAMPLVAAAGGARAQTADWSKVVEAAKKQGHLNVMHNIPPPMGETWFATFKAANPGIEVETTRLGSAALAQRFTTEYAAGASQTDVVMTLWDDTIDNDRLIAAIDDAGLTAVIQATAGSVDAVIEEGGRNLNGGQRQRIEIARALIREPAILILDEATAALDSESEYELLQAVRRRGMTCILVAHRLSTIRDCDEIIVLERGKEVERGTHASLIAEAGAYARLIKAEVAG